MSRGSESKTVGIWGAELRPTDTDTRFLATLCGNPSQPMSLPFEMGEYTLVGLLGQGGMGVVFEGLHRRMQRRVAIKVLSSSLAQTAAARNQFLAEIRAVARLLHPRIVTAFDAGQCATFVYLVMEYVDGLPLNEVVVRRGRLSAVEALRIVRQAAEGLSHAHHNRVIHRDVKPSNMMLASDGGLKILDLGLASLSAEVVEDPKSSNTKTICGTPEFMAPEQFDSGDLTPRVDIYALGCTLYFLLTGRPPYIGSFFELMRGHCTGAAVPLSNLAVPDAEIMQPIVSSLMAVRPAERPATMEDVIDSIDERLRHDWEPLPPLREAKKVRVPREIPHVDNRRGTEEQRDKASGYSQTVKLRRQHVICLDVSNHHWLAATAQSPINLFVPVLGFDGSAALRASIAASRSRGVVIGDKAWRRCLRGGFGCENIVESLALDTQIDLGGGRHSVSLGVSLLLKHIHLQTRPAITQQSWVEDLVVTVPSYFNQTARARIQESASLAGFEKVHLFDRNLAVALSQFQPDAAVSSMRPQARDGAWICASINTTGVEIAVLSVDRQQIHVRSVAGMQGFGTTAWEKNIRNLIRQRLFSQRGVDEFKDLKSRAALVQAISSAIDALEENPHPNFEFPLAATKVRGTLSTALILASCVDQIQLFGDLLGRALAEAGIDAEEVSHCVMSGPFSRCEPIVGMMSSFGVRCELVHVSPDQITSAVASWTSQSTQVTCRNPKLVTCSPSHYGIGFAGNKPSNIALLIPRLTSLPAIVNQPCARDITTSSEVTLFESPSSVETVWKPFRTMRLINHPAPWQSRMQVDEQGCVSCEILGSDANLVSEPVPSSSISEPTRRTFFQVVNRWSDQSTVMRSDSIDDSTDSSR